MYEVQIKIHKRFNSSELMVALEHLMIVLNQFPAVLVPFEFRVAGFLAYVCSSTILASYSS